MLVDGDRRVLHWFGDLGMFLKAPEGRVEEDVLQLVHESLRSALGLARTGRLKATDGRWRERPLRLADGDRFGHRERRLHFPTTVPHWPISCRLRPWPGEVAAGTRPAVTELASAGLEIELQADARTPAPGPSSNCRRATSASTWPTRLTASTKNRRHQRGVEVGQRRSLQPQRWLEGKNGELVQLPVTTTCWRVPVGTLFLDSALQIRKVQPGFELHTAHAPGRRPAGCRHRLPPRRRKNFWPTSGGTPGDGKRIEQGTAGNRQHPLPVMGLALPRRKRLWQDGVVMTLTDITAVRPSRPSGASQRASSMPTLYGVHRQSTARDRIRQSGAANPGPAPIEGRRARLFPACPHGAPGAERRRAGRRHRALGWTSPKGRTCDLFDIPSKMPTAR